MNTKHILFLISIVGTIVCLSINLLAITGIFIFQNMLFIFPLMIGMAVVFVPGVIAQNKFKKEKSKEIPRGFKGMREQQKQAKEVMMAYWRPLPIFLKVSFVTVFFYAFVNFFVMTYFLQEGQAEYENGRYLLKNHGDFVRNLTKEEYLVQKSYLNSMFTGHIAAFYAFSMMFHYQPKINPQKT